MAASYIGPLTTSDEGDVSVADIYGRIVKQEAYLPYLGSSAVSVSAHHANARIEDTGITHVSTVLHQGPLLDYQPVRCVLHQVHPESSTSVAVGAYVSFSHRNFKSRVTTRLYNTDLRAVCQQWRLFQIQVQPLQHIIHLSFLLRHSTHLLTWMTTQTNCHSKV